MVRFSLILILVAPAVLVERTFQIMGTEATGIVIAEDRAQGLAALEAATGALREAESMLSTWRPATELDRVNRSRSGVPLEVTPEMAALLSRALRAAHESGGAFDPTVGALIRAWDLRGSGRIPDAAEIAAARGATGPWLVSADPDRGTVTRRDGAVVLEEGAFGKGYALELARRKLDSTQGIRGALLDLGGQALAWGGPPEGKAWPVQVAHPDHRDRAVAEIGLPAGWSASTSGASQRGIVVGGERFGHILDPRTGWPVPDHGSVTVVAPDAVDADILSTALYVLGARDGISWLGDRTDVAVLFLVRDEASLHAVPNKAMEQLLSWTDAPCLLDSLALPTLSSAPFQQIETESQFPSRSGGRRWRDTRPLQYSFLHSPSRRPRPTGTTRSTGSSRR